MSSTTTTATTSDPPPLLIIGAGLGRTGTTSFTIALERLGLKSYHMTKGAMDQKGHIAMWARHAKDRRAGGPGIAPEIARAMAELGYVSTNDMPACYIYKDLMKLYPNARVVLTIRGEDGNGNGEAWADSVLGSFALHEGPLSKPPFCWSPFWRDFLSVLQWHWFESKVPYDPATGMPERQALANFYDQWVQDVKDTVPADKLLVYAPQDGWKPLCDFLSPIVSPEIKARCDAVLASGDPYPRSSDRASMQEIANFMKRANFVVNWVVPVSLSVLVAGLALKTLLKDKRAMTPR